MLQANPLFSDYLIHVKVLNASLLPFIPMWDWKTQMNANQHREKGSESDKKKQTKMTARILVSYLNRTTSEKCQTKEKTQTIP